MAGQFSLNLNQLEQFAPNSPVLAFRPMDSGSPQQDWCKHLAAFPHFRRELEEFAVLGDVVVRIADGREPAPFERVKILSLEYAVKTLKDETDAKEFIRSVRAIAAPEAGQYELEQIAAFYYGEIRRRSVSEVLMEMGLLGMQMEAVTATINEREIEFVETETEEQKLTVADERRIHRAAQKNLSPLPAPTPNFDAELAAVRARVRYAKATKQTRDDFAEFYLDDDGKSCEELDADFTSFEKLEQYDENGIVGFSMSDGQHAVVVYDLSGEIDASYLPQDSRSLAREMNLIFVGQTIGGAAAQKARQFVFAQRVLQNELREMEKGASKLLATSVPSPEKFSALPFTGDEFNDWLAAKLDHLYPRRVLRNVRRQTHNKAGFPVEFAATQEVNPDFEEMQYVAGVCQILWSQMQADFHLRSMRREMYQTLHTRIRSAEDTADVAQIKKEAYDFFKEQKKLNLKEFTALNTAAKSQEIRLADKTSDATRKTLAEIERATLNRIRYLKYFLYNDASIQSLTRQEKQRLWDAIRKRETALQAAQNKGGLQNAKPVGQSHILQPNAQKQIVRVTPRSV